MARIITASDLTIGDTFRYGHHVYIVTHWMAAGDIVTILHEGSSYPMDFYRDSEVELLVRRQRQADPKPYKLLYRSYDAAGNCDKGGKEFATRKQMDRWIARNSDRVAVTFTN